MSKRQEQMVMPDTTMPLVEGVISRVTWYGEDTGKAILRVTVDGKQEAWLGVAPTPREGMRVRARGPVEIHPQYGPQRQCGQIMPVLPVGTDGMRAWLSGGALPGIGPSLADAIIAKFGDRTRDVFENDPRKLLNVVGIGETKLKAIQDAWGDASAELDLQAFFAERGVSTHIAGRIAKTYGTHAITVVSTTPFRLALEVPGVGFATADEIARAIGIGEDAPERAQAGALQALHDSTVRGDCYLPLKLLMHRTAELLGEHHADLYAAIRDLATTPRPAGKDKPHRPLVVMESDDNGDPIVFPRNLYAAESSLADRILALLAAESVPLEGAAEAIAEFERNTNSVLAPEQRAAVEAAAKHNVVVVTGGPGVGKTHCTKAIVAVFNKAKLKMQLGSPTGRAAKRLSEATGKPASTIHRMLGIRINDSGKFLGFAYDDETKLPVDVVAIDECFDGSQTVLTEDGWQRMRAMFNNQTYPRVWSRDPVSGNLELKPIVRYLRHKAPSSLLCINASRTESLRDGRKIRCTEDHKILTPNGYVKAADLRVGDLVCVRGKRFTAEQQSIVVGSLLGDGHMQRYCAGNGTYCPRFSAGISFMNGEAQLDYLKFKHRAFGAMAAKIRQAPSGYGDNKVWRFSIAVTDESAQLEREMPFVDQHKSGKRRWSPTDEFIRRIDAQALAIWYLDNGSSGEQERATGLKSYYASIHSQRFSRADNERLAAWLHSSMGIEAIPSESKGYTYLRFRKEATERLFDVIRPYVPACMSYKIDRCDGYSYEPPPENVATTAAPIRSITTCKPSSPYVYDIEVQDHHNYVAGNVVVSNCSMAPTDLANSVLTAMATKSRLVLIGDVDQLPSVGPGAVLRDIIESGVVPTVRLTKIFRQADGSGIIEAARDVNSGQMPRGPSLNDAKEADEFILESEANSEAAAQMVVNYVSAAIPQRYGFDPIRDVQVLTPMHKGPCGTVALNKALQEAINGRGRGIVKGSVTFKVGDPVLQLKNDYKRDVFNGDRGYVTRIDHEAVKLWVDMDGRSVEYQSTDMQFLSLAYACSVHKSQGSTIKCVVLVLQQEHYMLLSRPIVYTGITRAARLCVLIADPRALRTAVREIKREMRRTRLAHRLRGGT